MKRSIITLAALLLLGSIGIAAWRIWPVRNDFYTDADTIKTPREAAVLREILWQPPQLLPEVINSSDEDYEPRISPDGLTLLFVRRKAGNNADIYFSRKTPDGWTEPSPLDAVNSDSDDLGPVLTHDGRAIYFYSNRAGSIGGYDLWAAHRRGDDSFDFHEAVNLGPGVNSPFNEYGPTLTPGGDILYFASNRPLPEDKKQPDPDAWQATLREDLFHRTYDLYMAVMTERGAGPAQPLTALNTPYNDGAPAVSPVGDFLYFASDRPGGEGVFDLYRSRRLHGVHEPAHTLGKTVNSAANDLDPSLGMGGYGLYFSSDRDLEGTSGEGRQTREYNLFHTTSREVFVDAQTLKRPPIDWAAILSALWPNLLWLLIALSLLLLLLALMRRFEEKRLGLLTRCLLASMLAHLLIVLLLTLWGVTATIAGEFNRRGKIQIALVSPASGNEIAAQITGALTAVETPAFAMPSLDRADTPVEMPAEVREAQVDVRDEPLPIETTSTARLTALDANVEWRPDPREGREPKEFEPAPVELAVSTPVETSRISRKEVVLEVAPSNRPVQIPQRPDVALQRPDVTERSVEVAPATAPSLLDNPALKESLAQQVETAEAAVARDRYSSDLEVAVTTDLPPTPGLQLAMATSDKLPEVVEVQLDPTERTVAVPRLRLADHAKAETVADTPSELAPAPSDTDIDTIDRFAEAQVAQATDAVPSADPPVLVDESSDVAVPPSAWVDVSAPQEAARIADATEQVDSPAPSVRLEALRPVDVAIDAEVLRHRVDRLQPAVATAVRMESSLAAVSDQTPVNEAMPEVEPARHEALRAEPVLPEWVTIDLPRLEEVASVRVAESTESYELVAVADVRADADSWLADARDAEAAMDHTFAPVYRAVDSATDAALLPSAIEIDEIVPDAPPEFDTLTPTDVPTSLEAPALALELPQEETPPDDPYMQRTAPNRMDIVKRMGGSEETERAVALALQWLARHQDEQGYWDIRVYDKRCGGCDDTKQIRSNIALTGLATLCFLGAGHTQETDGPYRDNVARAIDWLLTQQVSNGDIRGEETMYTQGIAAIALSEALAMTEDDRLREPVELALRYIYAARNRREGGWRYDPGQPGDTSVLGWMMMAMKSASISGVSVPRDAFDAGADWLAQVSHPRRPGLYKYRPERDVTPSMTAEGMFIQQLLGRRASEPIMQASADYILAHLPVWDEDPNTYFWYYASLALFQHQGSAWETWNESLKRELVEHQRQDGAAAGSWNPQGNEWSMLGGRVYQTALCTLMLEVYYRYLPLYAVEDPELPARRDDAIGTIAGIVRDAETGKPLVGATVRLDVSDGEPVLAGTDRDGFYYLWAPELPPFFALSASRKGYTPDSRNVDSTKLGTRTLDVDFNLVPARGAVIVTEAVPEVHHLGDNRFEGRINSQFQKPSEGAEYGSEFTLTSEQLAGRIRRGEVRLMAKGVQRRHSIFINGTLLGDRLDDAPSDGSFGEFRAPFDPGLLRVGENTIDIVARPSDVDIDDFEFVNVQIHLVP